MSKESNVEKTTGSQHYNCEAMKIASMPGGGTTIGQVHDAIEALIISETAPIVELLKERDSLEDKLDSLSNAIAAYFGEDVGEHSSANDPWYNAFQLLRDNTTALTQEKISDE